ncbi:hypothetical protein LTR49_022394, partial [Elasticomyces elasticus]
MVKQRPAFKATCSYVTSAPAEALCFRPSEANTAKIDTLPPELLERIAEHLVNGSALTVDRGGHGSELILDNPALGSHLLNSDWANVMFYDKTRQPSACANSLYGTQPE